MRYLPILALLGVASATGVLKTGQRHALLALKGVMERQLEFCQPVREPATCERSCGPGYVTCIRFPTCYNPGAGDSCCSDGSERRHHFPLFPVQLADSCSILSCRLLLHQRRLLSHWHAVGTVRRDCEPECHSSARHGADDRSPASSWVDFHQDYSRNHEADRNSHHYEAPRRNCRCCPVRGQYSCGTWWTWCGMGHPLSRDLKDDLRVLPGLDKQDVAGGRDAAWNVKESQRYKQ